MEEDLRARCVRAGAAPGIGAGRWKAAAPFAMLALAVLCWSGNWIIGRALRFDAPPVALTFWRWAIALLLMLPFTYRVLRAERGSILASWKLLCLLGLMATVLQHIPQYIGLRETTATNGALINATSPIFIVLLSTLLTRERLKPLGLTGIVLSVCGVAYIVGRGEPAALVAFEPGTGELWVLLSTVAWASYTVCLRWLPPGFDRGALLTLLAAFGVIACAPLYALEIAGGRVMQVNAASVAGIAYIGAIATVLGYLLWNRGVEAAGPSRAGPFMYLMLVFTPILSMLFLDEWPQLYHLVGAALIVSGISMTASGGAVAVRADAATLPRSG